ncbi:DUF202 domain-containing protein [Microbacterium sp.]|uniref:DUF202 domain-containing protein n=1 Tax=Microbacterium sp. TaxID=51671 RepID=UPI003A93D5A6
MSRADTGWTGPFDVGLQVERTALSWRRTALSLAVGSLVALRLLPEWLHDGWWVLPGMAGLIASAALWVVSRRRHDAFMVQVRSETRPRIGGALAIAVLAAGVASAGLLGLVVVLLTRL